MFDEKQAELAKLNRDLRFKPANPDKARTLTAEQVAFYNTNGYLKPFRIFDESQTRANRAYFDFLTAETHIRLTVIKTPVVVFGT